MKINRQELLTAVKMASKITSKKSRLPVLSTVLIDGKKQELMATDLDIYLHHSLTIEDYQRETIPEEIPEEFQIHNNLDLTGPQLRNLADDYGIEIPVKGKIGEIREAILEACFAADERDKHKDEVFCIPCNGLKKILSSIDDETVEIREMAADANLIGHAPRFRIGENFHDIAGVNPDEFPLYDGEDWALEAGVNVKLADMQNVAIATTDDDVAYKLLVIHFDLKNGKMVATDGHRLHLASLEEVEGGSVESINFPKDGMKILKDMEQDGKIFIGYGNRNFRIDSKKRTVYIRAMDTRFPDYRMVVPDAEKQHSVTLEKADIEKPLKSAMTLADERYCAFKVKFNGGMDVETINPEKGTYQKTSVPIIAKNYSNEEFVMGYNTKYFLDAVKTLDKEITLRFEAENKPLTMGKGGFTALIMPMRIDNHEPATEEAVQ